VGLGILGEYLGRIYNEVKARPLYLVARAIGFDRHPPTATIATARAPIGKPETE